MSSDVVVSLKNVSKTFKTYAHPVQRLIAKVSGDRIGNYKEFAALQDVSFDIYRGETVGIVGRNGAGKSTLLQIICGISQPTTGSVNVHGRISALLELGSGFQPDFTGRENVYLQGAIMGLSSAEMDACFDEIASFADIGEYLEQPVKTYSSGMFVRLAFAIAVAVAPDIFIVDEALAVGDFAFQTKCFTRMRNLVNQGGTLLFVAHDINIVKSLCNKSIYLGEKKVKAIGNSGDICDRYVADLLATSNLSPATSAATSHNARKKPEQAMRITTVTLTDVHHVPVHSTVFGQEVILKVEVSAMADANNLIASIYIKDARQLEILGICSEFEGVSVKDAKAGETYAFEFRFRNSLRSGSYGVTVILADSTSSTQVYYDWVDGAITFESIDIPGQKRWAMVNPVVHVAVTNAGHTPIESHKLRAS